MIKPEKKKKKTLERIFFHIGKFRLAGFVDDENSEIPSLNR